MPSFLLKRLAGAALALGLLTPLSTAKAQIFTNLIFFGDSNTDSGRYKYVPQTKNDPTTYHVWGFTTQPGLMWSENLGLHFGIAVTPSSAPGGGNNYAAGGARVVHSNSKKNQWSATQQVAAYLASTGSVADPRALYTILIGTNDLRTDSEATSPPVAGDYGNIVSPVNQTAIRDLANRTAGLVKQLYAAGARNFLLPNLYGYSGAIAEARADYSKTIWQAVAADGINFVPADIWTIISYVRANPNTFGLTSVSSNTPACGNVLSVDCTPANWVAPNADQTYLYADTAGHLSSAGQKIESDYYYSLLAAPSQISFLAEAGIKRHTALVSGMRNQIDLSFEKSGDVNAWITGDVQFLRMRNAPGFPNDPGNPASLNIGFDYKFAPEWLGGFSFGYGGTKQTFDTSGGQYTMNGPTASLYGAFRSPDFWATTILSASALSFEIDRRTALGIAAFSNKGSTSGDNLSAAFEGGYDFSSDLSEGLALKHGPVIGLIAQRMRVHDFTETNEGGAPTPLSFNTQIRRSAVTALGYRATLNLGPWTPFAKATWNHEFLARNREVVASLTSLTAPSYAMPAARLGRNFVTAELGTRYKLDERTAGFISFGGQLGQSRARALGVQLGLNVQLD